MKHRFGLLLCLGLSLLAPISVRALDTPLQHQLVVRLDPARQMLDATDRITLPANAPAELTMYLHSGLDPRISQGDARLEKETGDGRVTRYRLRLGQNTRSFELSYSGRLHHQLESDVVEQARGYRNTAGLIDERGVFLSSASLWYAQFDAFPYLTFELNIELPADWRAVSQGRREAREAHADRVNERWRETEPQEEIYLIAAAFTEYREAVDGTSGAIEAQVFLRSPDPGLAARYQEATGRYLRMYEKLLGPYPYAKFALVENFWETGFGMPSFTLLGSKVIRLPFILNSSYPHEILHNWWGNGVYVDFASGNWSEGLTAYLADHLIKQQQGQAAAYRQQSLQKYRDYAAAGRDFALAEFRGRHSPATEAVGYGKTMMLFHMLRNRIGDDAFVRGLQRFYDDYRFEIASFGDLERVFSLTAGQPLAEFFAQWVDRVGAPELGLRQTRVTPLGDGYRLELTLEQRQAGPAYRLDVPLAISLDGGAGAEQRVLSMTARQQEFSLDLPRAPARIDVDPQFDLFRKLAPAETPAAFTQLFGARELTVVLPRAATHELKPAWQAFARGLGYSGPKVDIVWDDEIESLPPDRAVAVLGWSNRFAADMRGALENDGVEFTSEAVKNGLTRTPTDEHAFAWVTRAPGADPADAPPHAWITTDLASALPGLGRKLPHYHKYSYLAFAGEAAENSLKGRWQVRNSPLTAILIAGSPRARLPAPAALIEAESPFSKKRMLTDLRFLSDPALAGRGFGEPGLEKAAGYIAAAMADAGLDPGGDDGGYFQSFGATGGVDDRGVRLSNVVGVLAGNDPAYAGQSLVIGAHYDHLGQGWPDVRAGYAGQVHPGADDNASGVAVLLELARELKRSFKPARSIVFVAFSAEEAGRLGSRAYLRQMAEYPASQTIGMLNLDSVGRLFDNRLLVLGAESAGAWPHIFRGIGFVTGIQSVMVSEPLDASDQVSFHEAGVPAVQLFTGAHADYHRPGDSADKIDADGLVKVAEVSRQVIEYLAMREDRLDSRLQTTRRDPADKTKSKVSLGTLPDFTHDGAGYRLDGVVPGSPAEQAGLRKADIIIAIDGKPVDGVRSVSDLLKSFETGQTVSITYLRGSVEHRAEARLIQR